MRLNIFNPWSTQVRALAEAHYPLFLADQRAHRHSPPEEAEVLPQVMPVNALVHPPSNQPGTQRRVAKGAVLAAGAAPGMPPLCVCVCAQCADLTPGTAALHIQHWPGTGSCPWKASLTFPGSCWVDRAFLELQCYAYTSKPHIQCIECLFMLNRWDASCLHTCIKSLACIAQLWSTL